MKRDESFDEFEKLIWHAEFEKILKLAGALKDQKDMLDRMTSDQLDSSSVALFSTDPNEDMQETNSHGANRRPSSRGVNLDDMNSNLERIGVRGDANKSHDDFPIENAVSFIRRNLAGVNDNGSSTMSRGKCAITDSLIDETINTLTEELKMCLDLKRRLRETSSDEYNTRSHNKVDGIKPTDTSRSIGRKGGRDHEDGTVSDEKGEPVSTKFAKWQTDILTNWMIEHRVSCD